MASPFVLATALTRDAARENQPAICAPHKGITRGLLDVLAPEAKLAGFVPHDPDEAASLIELRGVGASGESALRARPVQQRGAQPGLRRNPGPRPIALQGVLWLGGPLILQPTPGSFPVRAGQLFTVTTAPSQRSRPRPER
jgi:hypothetical protein